MGGIISQKRRTMKTQRMQNIALSTIIIGSCVLWQLLWMKQAFVAKERYRFNTNHGNGNHNIKIDRHIDSRKISSPHYKERINNDINIDTFVSTERGSVSSSLPRIEEEHTTSSDTPTSTSTSTTQQTAQANTNTLLDMSLIRNSLLREAPWAESHGANHLAFLGAGMLYYSMAYSFRSQTIVVLGSGGGFVPRMLKQAQRDLTASGIRPDRNGLYDLYLVDAHLASAGWGSTFYAKNENTTMRKEFSDINYVFQLTDDAYENYFRPMYKDPKSTFTIDYLHVDADHGFEQSWKDFDNYSQLLSDRAVISFHDTCYDNVTRNCHLDGVPETIEKLKRESRLRGLQVIDMHYLYRGIAFAVRETAPALETPRDRRINFCINNADLIHRTAEGFTKNGRVGSLPTLGDFMNCSFQFNEMELLEAKSQMNDPFAPTNGIMAVPCPIRGFRRNAVTGRCDKCIPGLTGKDCQKSKYKSTNRVTSDGSAKDRDDNNDDDVLHLADAWLRAIMSSSRSVSTRARAVLEVGPNAWKIPKARSKNETDGFVESKSLLFGSLMMEPSSLLDSYKHKFSSLYNVGDVIVVDPFLVDSPVWIDRTVSSRHRIIPCILKDAIDFDEREKNKKLSSSSSPLFLDAVDTIICLSCDDLVTMSSSSATMSFLDSTFPHLQTIVLGMMENEELTAFLNDATQAPEVVAGEALDDVSRDSFSKSGSTEWRLDRDVTMSLGANSRKRLVLLTRI